ncbi:DUF3095 family protein, partial [Rhizobium ruizarguesonis]
EPDETGATAHRRRQARSSPAPQRPPGSYGHPVPVEMAIPRDIAMPKGSGKRVDEKRWSEVASHSDFRKFDDGLRLTLDCTREQIERVETMLLLARARGEVNLGLHRQSHALMTCLVPS